MWNLVFKEEEEEERSKGIEYLNKMEMQVKQESHNLLACILNLG